MQAATVSTDTDGRLLVELRGDIDFTTSPAVLQVVREGATRVPAGDIRVDLGQVTFLDSSGIGVLVRLMHLAEERGARLRLEHVGAKVHDQLHISGLSELFGLDAPPDWLSTTVEDRG